MVKTVKSKPVTAVGLTDRGTLLRWLYADFILFAWVGGNVVIKGILSKALRVS